MMKFLLLVMAIFSGLGWTQSNEEKETIVWQIQHFFDVEADDSHFIDRPNFSGEWNLHSMYETHFEEECKRLAPEVESVQTASMQCNRKELDLRPVKQKVNHLATLKIDWARYNSNKISDSWLYKMNLSGERLFLFRNYSFFIQGRVRSGELNQNWSKEHFSFLDKLNVIFIFSMEDEKNNEFMPMTTRCAVPIYDENRLICSMEMIAKDSLIRDEIPEKWTQKRKVLTKIFLRLEL